MNEKDVEAYAPPTEYLHIVCECALFLLIGVLRKIFLEDRVGIATNANAWRAKLNIPW